MSDSKKFSWVASGYLAPQSFSEITVYKPNYSFMSEDLSGCGEVEEDNIIAKVGEPISESVLRKYDNVRVLNRDLPKLKLQNFYEHRTIIENAWNYYILRVNSFLKKIVTIRKGDEVEIDHRSIDVALLHSIVNELKMLVQNNSIQDILRMTSTNESLDNYLAKHSLSVATINGLIARWAKYSESMLSDLIMCGLVHDIGMVTIGDDVLNKPSKLTPEELENVRHHPEKAYYALKNTNSFSDLVLRAVIEHHERVDGKGYPRGIVMNQTSLMGRVTSVSDTYSAMSSKRSFRDAFNPFKILSDMNEKRGIGLDSSIISEVVSNITDNLIGVGVVVSDNSCRRVVAISPFDLEHPIVKLNDDISNTDDRLYVKHFS